MFKTKSQEFLKIKAEAAAGRTKSKFEKTAPARRNPLWHELATSVQTKLTVSSPTDSYEREAERIAAHVMRMQDAKLYATLSVSRLQRSTLDLNFAPPHRNEEEAQRAGKEMGDGPLVSRESVEPLVRHTPSQLPAELGVSSPGEPLPTAVRTQFEPHLGMGLASVRVHSGPDAARSALSLNARAYTMGSHIVFGTNQYSPGSRVGQTLLAHELTHVVQQSGAGEPHGKAGASIAVQRDKLPTIPLTSVRARIAELKAQKNYALGGGDIPVLELLDALQIALRKNKSSEITKAVDAFVKAVDAQPMEAATQALIGNVGDDMARKLVAKGLTDEADRILAHFHATTGSYESANLFGTTTSYVAMGSGYFPDASELEGGFKDRLGNPLHTLQDFHAGKAPFVSVAMDADNGPPLGTRLSIDEFPGVVFRVVDTGGAFVGKGLTRIDICTANKKESLDPTINGPLHLRFAIPLPHHEPLVSD